MTSQYDIPIWKSAPFTRILLPLVAGILLQWYIGFSFTFLLFSIGCFGIAFLLVELLPVSMSFNLRFFRGALLYLIILGMAMVLTLLANKRANKNWYGHFIKDSSFFVVRIAEPLVEKTNSFRAEGIVEKIITGKKTTLTSGKILLYFSKKIDTLPTYGDALLCHQLPQRINNTGNPGAFNYRRYMQFQGIFHSIYLQSTDYIQLSGKKKNVLYSLLYQSRQAIVAALRKNIPGKKELAIAEALLIGYKEDLDKDLVQAYSNTGVVHIIAISGLHLGLIYAVLLWMINRTRLMQKQKLLSVLVILSALWIFSLLTGASASVLRSAVMFTCILIGKTFFKQSTSYNALAASAFVLLCYQPYFLWDVGFQLSYTAVIGIMWLQGPIYKRWFIKNKWLQKIWQAASITLAAQIFTLPIILYYFHQFPNLFLIANLIAVPLSTAVLYAEIILLLFAWFSPVASVMGKICYYLLYCMNTFIEWLNQYSFAVTNSVYATTFSTCMLYVFILFLCWWLMHRKKYALILSIAAICGFFSAYLYQRFLADKQKKIIVYNINKQTAVDFIWQSKFYFFGDSSLQQPSAQRNFYLEPARMSMLTAETPIMFANLSKSKNIFTFYDKKMAILDSNFSLQDSASATRSKVDIVLLTKNTQWSIPQLQQQFEPRIIVFDASNSLWKIEQWKAACDTLHLRFHSTPEEGAFILNL